MPVQIDLWIFAALVFGVVVLPGMDMAFVAGSALAGGNRAGLAAVAGIVVAGQVHVLAAYFGLSALLALWPRAQGVLLLAGAAYVAWIGWSMLRSEPSAGTSPPQRDGDAAGAGNSALVRRAFLRAAATCLMNPKAYAFTLAVLPMFMGATASPGRLAALGAIIAINQLLVYGVVAVAAAGAGRVLQEAGAASRWVTRSVGLLLLGSAVVMSACTLAQDVAR